MVKHLFNNETNRKEAAMAFESQERAKAYWDKNVKLMISLMVIWFVVSFGCGILFVDELNQFQIGGYKLGFWFAQQGSIYTFLGIIFYYAWKMRQIDREFDVDE
ncbi:RNA polymerase subunit sigma-32 [Vibrio coralliilyticus OCN008]|jgi:putative solute:sodium symporter small subunit|nr:RNA polymerase subunit sigma-32 [Vibrio coralliilyticus OCN008]